MAIRAERLPEVEVSRSRGALWEKASDFLGSLAEILDIYFGSPKRLDHLESEYRSNLSVRERTELDARLHGI